MGRPNPEAVTSAPAGPRGVRIEHCIGIQTPAEVIWELLYAIDGWSRWNPLYVRASGLIYVGETINMAVALPGMKPQNARATVLESVPNEQLRYQTAGFGGLLRGTRYVEIEQSGSESCIVSNGEIMGGLLGQIVARGLGRRVHKGLQLMNEALKEVAEAKWQGRLAQTGWA